MPVRVNLRHLEKGPVHLEDEISPEELELNSVDELVQVHAPISYNLDIERIGKTLLVQGTIGLQLDCECARCLKAFSQPLQMEDWKATLPLEGEEQVAVDNDCVDLTPYLREDILLAFPQHPLCEAECSGLSNAQDRAAPGQGEAPNEGSPAWAELNKLKFYD